MSARMTFLTRTDPTRNINRFYIVHVMPTLFGRIELDLVSAVPAPDNQLYLRCG